MINKCVIITGKDAGNLQRRINFYLQEGCEIKGFGQVQDKWMRGEVGFAVLITGDEMSLRKGKYKDKRKKWEVWCANNKRPDSEVDFHTGTFEEFCEKDAMFDDDIEDYYHPHFS